MGIGRLVNEYPSEPTRSKMLMTTMIWPYGVRRCSVSLTICAMVEEEPARERTLEMRGTHTRARRLARLSAPT